DKNQLGLFEREHAAHLRARGLGLMGDDGDLGADQRVQKGRLAGIGRTNQGNKAAGGVGQFVRAIHLRSFQTFWRIRNCSATRCSATFLEGPMASIRSKPARSTAIVNWGAWSGPVRSTS